jgi:hypothetical protein
MLLRSLAKTFLKNSGRVSLSIKILAIFCIVGEIFVALKIETPLHLVQPYA